MFWRQYDRATTGLLALLGFAMFAIAIANALLRYFLAAPLVWGEEVSRYLMIWATLIGVAVAYRAGQHVAIGLVPDALPAVVRSALRILCHVLVLLTCLLLVRSGWTLAGFLGNVAAPSSSIPMGWIYAAIPAGGVMLAVEALRCLTAEVGPLARLLRP